MSFVNVISWFE